MTFCRTGSPNLLHWTKAENIVERGHNAAEKGSGNSHLKHLPININEEDLSAVYEKRTQPS